MTSPRIAVSTNDHSKQSVPQYGSDQKSRGRCKLPTSVGHPTEMFRDQIAAPLRIRVDYQNCDSKRPSAFGASDPRGKRGGMRAAPIAVGRLGVGFVYRGPATKAAPVPYQLAESVCRRYCCGNATRPNFQTDRGTQEDFGLLQPRTGTSGAPSALRVWKPRPGLGAGLFRDRQHRRPKIWHPRAHHRLSARSLGVRARTQGRRRGRDRLPP